MSYACAPVLVGVTSLVSEIPLPSKTVKFPFRSMDYSPWSSKNLIDQNQLKKFMQVEVDVKCMQTNFCGHGLSGFGDSARFFAFKMVLVHAFTFKLSVGFMYGSVLDDIPP